MREQQRLARVLLAIAGVVITHVLAYQIHPPAGGPSFSGHGYLDVAGPLLLAGGLGAVGWLAVAGARRSGLADELCPRSLLVAISSTYAALEVVEHLAGGASIGELADHHALWAGLLIAPAVALALVAAVRAGRRVASLLFERPRPVFRPGRRRVALPPSVTVACLATVPVGRRGPPRRA